MNNVTARAQRGTRRHVPPVDNPNFSPDTNYNSNGNIYFTYHGYHPSNPLAVEEVFGTQGDLQTLVT